MASFSFRRAIWLPALLLVVAAVVAISLAQARSNNFSTHTGETPAPRTGKAQLGFVVEEHQAATGSELRPLRLSTIRVTARRQPQYLLANGTLLAEKRAAVASNVGGLVAEVMVDKGDLVQAGDVLVQLDPTDAKNRLAEGLAMLEELKVRLDLTDQSKFDPQQLPEVSLARVAKELAEASFQRVSKLYERKVVSLENFDQARTEYELALHRYRQALLQVNQLYQSVQTAKVRLAILQKAVQDSTITAPFDGLVAERHVEVGEYVSAGPQASKVVTLVKINPLRLALTISQQDVGKIKQGQRVSFRVDSFEDRQFTATIRYIPPALASDTRSLIVEAEVPNPENLLRPGMFATARIELDKQQETLYVPGTAVLWEGDSARVFVVRDGVAREQVIALGEVAGPLVRVLSGLKGDELLVAAPALVREGMRISEDK